MRGQKASGTIASIKHPLQREFLACGFFLQEGRVGEISRNVILENTGYLSWPLPSAQCQASPGYSRSKSHRIPTGRNSEGMKLDFA